MENHNARTIGIDAQGAVNASAEGAVNDGGLGGANGALTSSDMTGITQRSEQMNVADANRAISAAGFSGLADDVRAAAKAGTFDYGGAIDVAKDGGIKPDDLPGATGPMDRDGILNVGSLASTSNAATAGLAEDVDRAEIGDAVTLGQPNAQTDGVRYDYDDSSNL